MCVQRCECVFKGVNVCSKVCIIVVKVWVYVLTDVGICAQRCEGVLTGVGICAHRCGYMCSKV
jgi:hypothetical protein